MEEQHSDLAAACWAFALWQHSPFAGFAATVAAFLSAEQHSVFAGFAATTAARDVAAQHVPSLVEA